MMIDSRTVQSTPESGSHADYDGHQKRIDPEASQAATVARRGAAWRGRCDIVKHPPLRDEIYARMQNGAGRRRQITRHGWTA